jgi:hypothetical protein
VVTKALLDCRDSSGPDEGFVCNVYDSPFGNGVIPVPGGLYFKPVPAGPSGARGTSGGTLGDEFIGLGYLRLMREIGWISRIVAA